MNILFLDNQSQWVSNIAKSYESLGYNISFLSKETFNTPIENIAKIISAKSKDIDLFFINANIIAGKGRDSCSGIELLKYLRLYGLTQHCVVFSFLNKEQLMQVSTHNLIIFSEGISFIRLPNSLYGLNIRLLSKKRVKQNLSSFFKAESNIQENRHFYANWWGVLQLWKVQQAVDSITNCKLKSEIEGSFFDLSLKSMYSYQGLLSKYLYGFSNTDIQNKLFQLENIRREKFEDEDRRKSEIRSEKEILEKENAELSMRLDSLNSAYMDLLEMIPNEMSSIAEDFLSKAQEKIAPIADELESNKSQIEKDEEFLKLKKNIEKEKKNVAEKLRKNNLKVKEIIQSFGSLDKRKSLTENKPSIIYVDDHANDGWAFVYQRIIYGDKCDKFTIIQPDENTSVEKITENICNSIKEKEERQEDVELIILDLRLQKNEIGNIDPSKISGIQVLQNLQQRNLSCPILITTASNKLWSYKNVIAFGADAFWIKEGVDTNNTIENTVENYLNFIGLVHMLCLSEEYELLSFFRKNLCKLKNKNGLWWEKRFWKDDIQYEKEEIPSRTKVIRMLEDACQIFRNYLILKIQFSHNSNIQDNMAAIFIIQAFQAIEYIHKYDNNNETRIADKIKSQIGELEYNNSKCRNILRFRNDSAHDFYIEHKLKDFIYCLFEYLEESPVASSIKVIGTIEITNSPTKSSTTYATKAKIEKEDIQESKIYISSIAQQNENKSYLFLIENPNLNLEGRRYIMLDCRKNNLDENTISIGTKMQFKIKVVNNGHSKAYYAEDVMIVS